MKKLFTLIAAAMAVLSVSAQTFKVSGDLTDGTKIVDNEYATITTVASATATQLLDADKNPKPAEYAGYSFNYFVNLRSDVNASAEAPTGADYDNSIRLVVVAKENVDLVMYYRVGISKTLSCFNQTTSKALTVTQSDPYMTTEDGGYKYVAGTMQMLKGNTYTVYTKGGTIQFHGVDTKASTYVDPTPVTPSSTDAEVIFSWENGTATVGTITTGTANEDRLGYENIYNDVTYKTICLNGKKDAIATNYMEVTPTKALKAGDAIKFTGYYNKDSEKDCSVYYLYSNGTTYGSENKFPGIQQAAIGDVVDAVPTDAAGSTSFKMTRNLAGTNIFITKMVITTPSSSAIQNVSVAAANKTVKYLRNGQLVIETANGTFTAAGARLK